VPVVFAGCSRPTHFTRLASRTNTALSLISAFNDTGLWPPIVPTMVLIESLRGDANANRFLKTCIVHGEVAESVARRAAEPRRRARSGSAVDALLVALAEPGGTVLMAIEPTSKP
jgi:hypothetical protein